MKTKRPLRDLVPDIRLHIERYRDTLQFNLRLYEVDEGQLRKEVEDSLRREMVSAPALQRALQRIPSINVLKKAVDKLSKVYAHAPIRFTENKADQELVDVLSKTLDIDNVMSNANRLYNLQRMAAIEFYVQEKKQCIRVLAGHQFLPFSDDPVNPLNCTVFIKFMGTEVEVNTPVNDTDGKRVTDQAQIRKVDIFHLYSDTEFLVIDSGGRIREDKMAELGRVDGKNPFGTIPFVLVSASRFELVPYPNKTGLDMAILIPKLLTDLNYAAQFLSHSILWSRNADLKGAEIHPDAVVDLGERGADGGDPEMGVISPEVDIEGVLQLIEFQMSGWLSSIGIKAATVGSMMPGREASGFAKAMDEGDATQERTVQSEEFKRIERSVWTKLAQIQKYWSGAGAVYEKRMFTPKFVENFSVRFGEMKHLTSVKEKVERVKVMRELKLMSRSQAVKELNPDFTPEQLEMYLQELEADKENDHEGKATGEAASPQFNGQQEVGEDEDAVAPNRESNV